VYLFAVLASVEELVKQRKLDDALRRRLEGGEADFAILREELVQESINTARGSDIGATAFRHLGPMGREAGEERGENN